MVPITATGHPDGWAHCPDRPSREPKPVTA